VGGVSPLRTPQAACRPPGSSATSCRPKNGDVAANFFAVSISDTETYTIQSDLTANWPGVPAPWPTPGGGQPPAWQTTPPPELFPAFSPAASPARSDYVAQAPIHARRCRAISEPGLARPAGCPTGGPACASHAPGNAADADSQQPIALRREVRQIRLSWRTTFGATRLFLQGTWGNRECMVRHLEGVADHCPGPFRSTRRQRLTLPQYPPGHGLRGAVGGCRAKRGPQPGLPVLGPMAWPRLSAALARHPTGPPPPASLPGPLRLRARWCRRRSGPRPTLRARPAVHHRTRGMSRLSALRGCSPAQPPSWDCRMSRLPVPLSRPVYRLAESRRRAGCGKSARLVR
jgi:hypothetical protein